MSENQLSENDLRQVVYVSSARRKFSAEEITSLLDVSRRNNARDGITGMLLYRDGNFIQAVEGPAPAIEDLMNRLRRDETHHGMIVMIDRPIQERDFGDWTMGFRNISGVRSDALPAGNAFWANPQSVPANEGTALRLLRSFRQSLS